MRVDAVGISSVGSVRQRNEDAWAVWPELGLFVIADGMGGHPAGDVAAQAAVEQLSRFASERLPQLGTPHPPLEEAETIITELIQETNTVVHDLSCSEERLAGMGTTLCVLYLCGDRAVFGHVGDSRIYRKSDVSLEQLTEDHSLITYLIESGKMSEQSAERSSYKSVLTRAVGIGPKVKPSIDHVTIEPPDLFLLCTDGLSDYVSHEVIEGVLTDVESLQSAADGLVQAAIDEGAPDNVTLVLVEVEDV